MVESRPVVLLLAAFPFLANYDGYFQPRFVQRGSDQRDWRGSRFCYRFSCPSCWLCDMEVAAPSSFRHAHQKRMSSHSFTILSIRPTFTNSAPGSRAFQGTSYSVHIPSESAFGTMPILHRDRSGRMERGKLTVSGNVNSSLSLPN